MGNVQASAGGTSDASSLGWLLMLLLFHDGQARQYSRSQWTDARRVRGCSYHRDSYASCLLSKLEMDVIQLEDARKYRCLVTSLKRCPRLQSQSDAVGQARARISVSKGEDRTGR